MKRRSMFVPIVLTFIAGLPVLLAPADAAPTLLGTEPVSAGSASDIHAAIGDGGVAAVPYVDVATGAVAMSVHRPGAAWVGVIVSAGGGPTPADTDAAIAGDGTIDVVWRAGNTVWGRRMQPSGAWESATPLSNGVNTPARVVVGGNSRGDVAVSWTEFFNGSDRVFVRRRPSGSAAWTAAVMVSDSTADGTHNGEDPQVVVDAAGGVVVAWLQQSGGSAYDPVVAALPQAATVADAPQAIPANPVTPPTIGALSPIRIAGDAQGRVALSVTDTGGHVWECYWDRTGSPSAWDNGTGSEAVPGFVGPGLPFVVVLSGSNPNQQLTMYEKGGSSDWSDRVTHLWSGASDVDQLAVAGDGQGRVLIAVREGGTGGHLTTITVAAGTATSHVQTASNAFHVDDVAMNSSGDALIGWYRLSPTSIAMATPYDVSGPSTAADPLPTWTLAPSATLTWTVRDTWEIGATSVVSRDSVGVATTGATSQSVAVPAGTTSCFTVRATDPSGNTGAESARTCTAAPFDDRALRRSTGWRKLTGSAYYAHTALRAKQSGRTLRKTVSALRLGLVASRCGTCGAVKVYVNGTLVRKISLRGPARTGVVFPIATYSAVRPAKVRIVTTSAKKVIVDGLAVSTS